MRESVRLVFCRKGRAGEDDQKFSTMLRAPKIVVVSQYADLRDSDDSLIATVTWRSDVQVIRETHHE